MIHWYCKMTIILRKRKNVKETIIVRGSIKISISSRLKTYLRLMLNKQYFV